VEGSLPSVTDRAVAAAGFGAGVGSSFGAFSPKPVFEFLAGPEGGAAVRRNGDGLARGRRESRARLGFFRFPDAEAAPLDPLAYR